MNPDNPINRAVIQGMEGTALAMKVALTEIEARGPAEFADAFRAMSQHRVDAFVVDCRPDTERQSQGDRRPGDQAAPPAASGWEFAESGGLLGYGPNVNELWGHAPRFVDKILKGAKPADLPVEQATKFELVDQPQDRQGARPHDSAVGAAARGRGDPVTPKTWSLTPLTAAMDRRTFIAGTGLAWLVAASSGLAQQDQPPYRIALVEAGNPSANQHFLDAFMAGLRDSGYAPGKNIVVDVRWAQGQVEGFRTAFAELIPLRPQVIVVSSALGAVEAKKATTSIPVVFIGVPDPIGSGLVDSLARPGGNLTGLARAAGDGLMGKTVQVLLSIAPGVTRLAILWNPAAAIGELRAQAVAAAKANGVTPLVVELRDRAGIEAAFTSMRIQRANGLFVVTDPLTLANRSEIVKFAASNRIPSVYEFGEFARAGGLVAYSPSVTEQFRRSAIYVDKILHGAKPGDLPVEQPTKFELVINQRAAKALGITIPKEILLRADEVIQ